MLWSWRRKFKIELRKKFDDRYWLEQFSDLCNQCWDFVHFKSNKSQWNKRKAYLKAILIKQKRKQYSSNERYAINYIEQEKSYTSKASFLDLDDIPVYDSGKTYIGKCNGRLINADLNSAANILWKSKQNFNIEELC